MGGFGSGRPGYSSAPTCESTNSIDLAWLRRRGMLRTGNRATLTRSRAGEQTGSIGVLVLADSLRLMYAVTAHDGTKISINELVPFMYTATQFRGRRQWLMCIKCGRGCARFMAALIPLPAMSRTEVRLPEGKFGPACHAAHRKDREPFA